METNNQPSIDFRELKLQQAQTAKLKPSIQLREVIKRGMDVSFALIAIILLTPIMLITAIVIKANDPAGAVFFRQSRIGRDGKLFKMFKFRSMRSDAEQYLMSNEMLYRKYVSNSYKLELHEDPRVTSIGRFLRKTSLDELPQFFNVLRGEMSLVGPRPVVREELLGYGSRSLDFLSVKPGITGYWQTCGRSSVGYPERADLELHYVYNRTISMDIKILFKTVWIVLRRKGAY
ncbi:sugar transferase [Paenibacillus glycanilyticus]|uniref:sugar transferase n=1 Tax=Paenibacillus glycanilyticus TaxID=126569 RepID=UPI003EBC8118